MNLRAGCIVGTVLVSLTPALSAAQEFSADVVYADVKKPSAASTGTPSPAHTSKLFVSKDKMRLETRGMVGTVLLVDAAEHTTTALFPSHKSYQPLAGGPSEYFRVGDAENACPDWQKATDQKISCEKVGSEQVGGRPAVKYLNKTASADSSTTAVWIDTALKFVIKWEGANTSAELSNIKEGQQSADLFTVPTTYDLLKPVKKPNKGPSPRPR
jgi:hypothetical protein